MAAGLATFVALLSHVAGGGAMPGWAGLVVPGVLSLLVCTALAGRILKLWRLSVAVATSQVLFHSLFVLGMTTPATGGSSAHSHHGEAIALPAMTESGALSTALAADASMWGFHAVAAIVTVAALHRGERTVRRLRDLATQTMAWVRRALTRPLALPGLIAPTRVVLARTVAVDAVDARYRYALRRRGPPAFG